MVVDDLMGRVKHSQGSQNSDWPFTDDKVVVGLDCEGINLGVKGQLTLLQLATMTGFSYVFDLISCPAMIDAGLKKLLESPDIVKVRKRCKDLNICQSIVGVLTHFLRYL